MTVTISWTKDKLDQLKTQLGSSEESVIDFYDEDAERSHEMDRRYAGYLVEYLEEIFNEKEAPQSG